MYLDILILALVTIAIFGRFFNILGREDDNANSRNQHARDEHIKAFTKGGQEFKVVDAQVISSAEANLPQDSRGVVRNIKILDPDFQLETFINGAKRAYKLMVDMIASGDAASLEHLVTPEVLSHLKGEINRRKESSLTLRQEVIKIKEFEITSCRLEEKTAYIETKIKTEQVWVLKDQQGNIIQGSDDRSIIKDDYWVFQKNLAGEDKDNRIWLLCSMKG